MVAYYYRIIDVDDNSIVANSIPTREQAHETLLYYTAEFPHTRFEIESYPDRRISGWGRDPDLYE